MSWTVPEIQRVDEPLVGEERAMLEGFLDLRRATFLHICAGLTGEQLARRAVPPSTLSLLGLIRHLAEVDRSFFRRRFAGEAVESLYSRPDNPGAEFEEVSAERAEEEVATLLEEWELCRQAVAGRSLDETYLSERWGEMSLRWMYLYMIEEYALHCGHAQLLRERIDGRTGF